MSSSKNMPQEITPQISGYFIIDIAGLYTDFNRAIMEYVDNSIDSAEKYFTEDANSYTKEININIIIDDNNERITVTDNCTGIEDLNALVKEIGHSDKKTDFTTNGQFGFGIYSFMAGCENIEFYSKHENNNCGYYLKISKSVFDKAKLNEVKINASVKRHNVNQGTQVILNDFYKNRWQEISFDDIKKTIGEHFDCLLRRKNFTITINQERVMAYDYDSIKGEIYREEIGEVEYTPRKQRVGKLFPQKITFRKPIKIFLKMSDKVEVSKPPVFVAKGRKINDIRSIKGFKSYYGSKNILWGHSQITGYIDLQDHFEPTIKRDDFKNIGGGKFKAFNQKLNELEQLIYVAFITDKNEEKANNTFNSLASKISDLINNLAREDILQLKTINLSKEGEGDGYPFEEGLGTKDRGSKKGKAVKGDNIGINEGDGTGVNIDKEGDDIFDDIQNPKKRSGLNITFTDEELIQLGNGKDYLRSQLVEDINGKTIKIYRKHSNFESRVKTSNKGEVKIAENLLNYISCEIAIHYKDELYSKNGNIPGKYEKEIFRDITDLIYKIEGKLTPLKGHSLSILNS